MADLFGWAGSVIAIVGALLNARKVRAGFLFYIASNIALVSVGVVKGELYNVLLFSVFLVISTYGFFKWKRIDQKEKRQPGGTHGR